MGYDDSTTLHLQQALLDYYATHFPKRPSLDVLTRWSGTMALTDNGLPLVGPVPEAPGSFWAAGFNGHGMGYGFHFGKMMAEHFTAAPSEEDYSTLFYLEDKVYPLK